MESMREKAATKALGHRAPLGERRPGRSWKRRSMAQQLPPEAWCYQIPVQKGPTTAMIRAVWRGDKNGNRKTTSYCDNPEGKQK